MGTDESLAPDDLEARIVDTIGDLAFDAWRVDLDAQVRRRQLLRWLNTAPEALRPALVRYLHRATYASPWQAREEHDALMQAMSQALPLLPVRARLLLEWLGRDISPWSYPRGGAVLTICALNAIPRARLVEVWRAHPSLLMEGMSRYLMTRRGWLDPDRWVHLLGEGDRHALLHHLLARHDGEVRRQALWALQTPGDAAWPDSSAGGTIGPVELPAANRSLLAHLRGRCAAEDLEPLRRRLYSAATQDDGVRGWVDRIGVWGAQAISRAAGALLDLNPDPELRREWHAHWAACPLPSFEASAHLARRVTAHVLSTRAMELERLTGWDRRIRDRRPRPGAVMRHQVRTALQPWLLGQHDPLGRHTVARRPTRSL